MTRQQKKEEVEKLLSKLNNDVNRCINEFFLNLDIKFKRDDSVPVKTVSFTKLMKLVDDYYEDEKPFTNINNRKGRLPMLRHITLYMGKDMGSTVTHMRDCINEMHKDLPNKPAAHSNIVISINNVDDKLYVKDKAYTTIRNEIYSLLLKEETTQS